MRASQVIYDEDIAPNGAILIERPSHGEIRRGMTDEQAARDIQRIGFLAYSASEWVLELAKGQFLRALDEHDQGQRRLASRAFNPESAVKVHSQYDRVGKSYSQGKRVEYWFGDVDPKPVEAPSYFWKDSPKGQP